eukprot:scaffold1396_cov252-Pinguiococcus_pyrenoidosus.AAC.33
MRSVQLRFPRARKLQLSLLLDICWRPARLPTPTSPRDQLYLDVGAAPRTANLPPRRLPPLPALLASGRRGGRSYPERPLRLETACRPHLQAPSGGDAEPVGAAQHEELAVVNARDAAEEGERQRRVAVVHALLRVILLDAAGAQAGQAQELLTSSDEHVGLSATVALVQPQGRFSARVWQRQQILPALRLQVEHLHGVDGGPVHGMKSRAGLSHIVRAATKDKQSRGVEHGHDLDVVAALIHLGPVSPLARLWVEDQHTRYEGPDLVESAAHAVHLGVGQELARMRATRLRHARAHLPAGVGIHGINHPVTCVGTWRATSVLPEAARHVQNAVGTHGACHVIPDVRRVGPL